MCDKAVCDKVVCEKVVCDNLVCGNVVLDEVDEVVCVTKLCVCVTKLCVCVTKLCVCHLNRCKTSNYCRGPLGNIAVSGQRRRCNVPVKTYLHYIYIYMYV